MLLHQQYATHMGNVDQNEETKNICLLRRMCYIRDAIESEQCEWIYDVPAYTRQGLI
jgi:hypothetical protein